eukprot:2698088-Rhodomonas_salina.3
MNADQCFACLDAGFTDRCSIVWLISIPTNMATGDELCASIGRVHIDLHWGIKSVICSARVTARRNIVPAGRRHLCNAEDSGRRRTGALRLHASPAASLLRLPRTWPPPLLPTSTLRVPRAISIPNSSMAHSVPADGKDPHPCDIACRNGLHRARRSPGCPFLWQDAFRASV